MALNWGEFLGDTLGKELGDLWPPGSDAVRDRVQALVIKWISGDKAAVRQALEAALKDQGLTEKEVIGILAVVAQGWIDQKFFASELTQGIFSALEDGSLTGIEVSAVAANWVANKTGDAALKELIKSSADGHLTRDEVEAALLTWVKGHTSSGVDAKLKAVIDGPDPLSLRSLIVMAVSFLAADNKITKPVSTIEKQIGAVVDALAGYQSQEFADVLAALADTNYAAAATTIVKKLGIDVSDELVQQVIQGRLPDVAETFLGRALKREIDDITDAQAGSLAKAIIGIVTGKVKVIPEKTEQESLNLNDWQYDVWTRVRKVLYAVKLALSGGAIVPTNPTAQPHVFAAAAITLDTALKSLASAESQYQSLLDLLQDFTYQEFRKEPGGKKYETERPIYMDQLKAGKTARFVFHDVMLKLFNV